MRAERNRLAERPCFAFLLLLRLASSSSPAVKKTWLTPLKLARSASCVRLTPTTENRDVEIPENNRHAPAGMRLVLAERAHGIRFFAHARLQVILLSIRVRFPVVLACLLRQIR